MSMVVQHNMQAMNANRMLGVTTSQQAKSTEKLSSGYRINRAADDAAGLSISEKMRKQIRGLDQASSNAQDGISSVQTAEGALTEVHSMLQRMNELANQAANGTNSEDDRRSIQDEIDQLTTEIDRVAETTKFNETYLLKGDSSAKKKEYLTGHDAGLAGTLTDSLKTATFEMDALKTGDSITIGGQNYTIGAELKDAQTVVQSAIDEAMANGTAQSLEIDGETYTISAGGRVSDKDGNTLTGMGDNSAAADQVALKNLVNAGSIIKYNDQTTTTMTDAKVNTTGVAGSDGIDDDDATIITKDKAYELITQALTQANEIGNTDGTVSVTKNQGTATIKNGTALYNADGNLYSNTSLTEALSNNENAIVSTSAVKVVGAANYTPAVADVYQTGDVTFGGAVGEAVSVKIDYVDKDGAAQTKTISFTTKTDEATTAGEFANAVNNDDDLKDLFTARTNNKKVTFTSKEAGANLKVTGLTVTNGGANTKMSFGADPSHTADGANAKLATAYDPNGATTNLYKADGTGITNDAELQDALAKGMTLYTNVTKAAEGVNYTYNATDANKVTFEINKGYSSVNSALNLNLHVGSEADMTNKIGVSIETMNSSYLGVKGLDVVGNGNDNGVAATYAIDAISDAISKVSAQRSTLGAVQNRLEHTIANLDNIAENTTSAESAIRDTDMAEEMVNFSKNNILAQAGQSMLAQANQSNQGVLSLLG